MTQPIFLVEDDGVVGFYSLKFFDGICELDNLWVVPTEMGRGYGAALLAHATAVAKRRGVQQIRIDSDPNAEAFYIRCGATVTGLVPAPIEKQPARHLATHCNVWNNVTLTACYIGDCVVKL